MDPWKIIWKSTIDSISFGKTLGNFHFNFARKSHAGFFRYATGHHQDIHVSPHCTIYNQMSGYSMFHFLPLLIGLYVGYVGQTFGAQAVTSMLRQIDGTCKAKKNGSYGQKVIAGPGELFLICYPQIRWFFCVNSGTIRTTCGNILPLFSEKVCRTAQNQSALESSDLGASNGGSNLQIRHFGANMAAFEVAGWTRISDLGRSIWDWNANLDQIFKKKSFSKKGDIAFYIGTKIYNKNVYDYVCKFWSDKYPQVAKKYSSIFLKYRKMDRIPMDACDLVWPYWGCQSKRHFDRLKWSLSRKFRMFSG